MTGNDVVRWRRHLGLQQKTAARMLGMTPNGLRKVEQSRKPIRKTIRLACAAIALGLSDYDGPDPAILKR